MKKYLRFICSVCKRSTDKLVDNMRAAPDRCTITLQCEGRLLPAYYLSNAEISPSARVGVTDWRPRQSEVAQVKNPSEVTLLNTSTGSFGQVALAVRLPFEPDPTDTLVLTLEKRVDTPRAYRQYIYRVENTFSSVSGTEAGLEKKTLRFSPTDSVEVFMNGVKVERGTAPENYQITDGSDTSPIPPNTISFNSPIVLPGITQIDVVVSQASPTTTSTVTFKRATADESRRGTGAWENVSRVLALRTIEETYYIFYCDLNEATDLQLNTILTPTSTARVGLYSVSITDLNLLLAREPYTPVDRYTSVAVPLVNLDGENGHLKFVAVDGKPRLFVTSGSVEPIYPPLKVVRFVTETPITTPTSGSDNQLTTDGALIVGPDV